tara:strand:- start:2413 stop:2901 length:489 start_codon:yes stop_codon:yes gene_type:complete
MPNHCSNRVTLYGDDAVSIQKLHSIFIKGIKNGDKVFGHFIPEPDWKTIPLAENDIKEYTFSSPRGEVGELPVYSNSKELYFASTGHDDDRWYNWRINNWGTKWDCYSLKIDDTNMPDEFEVRFETAWSPPEGICNAIRGQYDTLSLSWFYDEPGRELAGYL